MLSPATLTRKTPLPFNSLGFSGIHTSYFNRRRTLTEAGSSRALSFGHKLNRGGRVNWSGRSGTVLGHLGRVYSVSGGSSSDSGGIGGSGGGGGGGGDSSGGGGDEGSGGNGNKWSFLYLALLSNYPVLTKAVSSAILTLIGDLICQNLISGQEEDTHVYHIGIRTSRSSIAFLVFVFEQSGDSFRIIRRSSEAFTGPVCFCSCFVGVFLSAVVTLEGKPSHVIPKLKQEWTGAVVANWQLWIPFQFLNFRFVPQNFQVLASNVVALAWNVILSFKAHKEVVAK
ncbi:hypothetical protein Bca52824_004834 [Brassica carinata]|uniref:Uncharacterized protein n=1 Tax=Brassica carinata TaxID=52824 RepID=A0A8X8BCM3_BRACI|nr:hypothetical protein Bca52824_004834 [Brassica carinata]